MNWAYRTRPIDRTESFPTEWALSSDQPADNEQSSLPLESLPPANEPIRSEMVATAHAS